MSNAISPLVRNPPMLGNTCGPATLGIVKPCLGHIQLAIDYRRHSIANHRGEDADLAVVGLAQATVPLPGYAHRLVALLGKGTLINQQRAGMPKMRIVIGDQLPTYVTTIPGRLAQHVMQPLILATANHLGHLLHISPPALEKTVEIPPRRLIDRACAALEARQVEGKVGIEVREHRSDQPSNAI